MDAVVDNSALDVAPPRRIAWGAVVGGAFLSVAIWILLEVLGLAIGLSALDPNQRSFKALGIGAGLWTLVAPLVALFIGGLLAGRLSGSLGWLAGALHGGLVWALTLSLGVLLVGSLGRAVVSGAAGAAGTVLSQGVAGPSSLEAVGIEPHALLGPVNARLREAGRPPMSADQLDAAASAALGKAVHGGRVDAEAFATEFVARTGLSHGDAGQLGALIASRWNAATGQLRFQALTAADKTGKALFWVFGALMLGLISAALGAVAGAPPRRRSVVVEPPIGTVVPPPQGLE